MLSRARENLLGKLLLSSALVAVSLAYGVWQKHQAGQVGPSPAHSPSVDKASLPLQAAKVKPAPVITAKPDSDAVRGRSHVSKQAIAVSRPSLRSEARQVATPVPAPQQAEALPAPPPPDPQPAQAMILPSDDVSPPIALVTGAPPPGIVPPIPAGAGTHLLDGDYVSDRHQLEWGDLKVKISVHGGQITGVQILQYPDHRSRSLDLSLMAGPILESEVIKAQQAQVDVVSSATDTSYAFQDTIANVIIKAARE